VTEGGSAASGAEGVGWDGTEEARLGEGRRGGGGAEDGWNLSLPAPGCLACGAGQRGWGKRRGRRRRFRRATRKTKGALTLGGLASGPSWGGGGRLVWRRRWPKSGVGVGRAAGGGEGEPQGSRRWHRRRSGRRGIQTERSVEDGKGAEA
jgi:hypothetical protein